MSLVEISCTDFISAFLVCVRLLIFVFSYKKESLIDSLLNYSQANIPQPHLAQESVLSKSLACILFYSVGGYMVSSLYIK